MTSGKAGRSVRRRSTRVAWSLLAVFGVGYAAEYAYVTRPGSLPGAALAAWFQW
jgi:hypothetical protein